MKRIIIVQVLLRGERAREGRPEGRGVQRADRELRLPLREPGLGHRPHRCVHN